MPITLLDPRNDYVFKRLFADSPALLADLIRRWPGGHGPVRDAMARLPALSADEEAKRRAFERERALHDEISLLNAARGGGLEEGLEAGRVEGRADQLAQLLGYKFGALPPGVLQQLRAADAAQLDHWGKRMLAANSLDQVFGDGQGVVELARCFAYGPLAGDARGKML